MGFWLPVFGAPRSGPWRPPTRTGFPPAAQHGRLTNPSFPAAFVETRLPGPGVAPSKFSARAAPKASRAGLRPHPAASGRPRVAPLNKNTPPEKPSGRVSSVVTRRPVELAENSGIIAESRSIGGWNVRSNGFARRIRRRAAETGTPDFSKNVLPSDPPSIMCPLRFARAGEANIFGCNAHHKSVGPSGP